MYKTLFLSVILFALMGCIGSDDSGSGSNVDNGKNCQIKFDNETDIFYNTEAYSNETTSEPLRVWNANSATTNGDDTGPFWMRIMVNTSIIEEVKIPNIEAGGFVDIYLAVDRSLFPAGVYTVTLDLDVFNDVGETNESDNQHQETVTIIGTVYANN